MKKILILLFTTLFITSCGSDEVNNINKYYSTGVVSTGSINTGESFIGYTESFNTINLSPKVGGKIMSINFFEGDKINNGDLVASLDGNEAKSGYSNASDILDTLYKLRESTSGMFDEQINAMNSKISQAEIGVKGTTTGVADINSIGEEQLKTILSQKEELENSIKNTKLTLNQKEIDLYIGAKNAIASSMIVDTNVIVFLDELLGVTDENDDKNDSFENYLGAKNTNLKSIAENDFKKLYPIYVAYKTNYEDKILNGSITNIEIDNLLNNGIELNSLLRDLLKTTYDVVDSSVVSSNFSSNTISTYKNTISNFQSNIESVIMTVSGNYIVGLQGSIDNISNFKNSSNSTLENLEKKLDVLNQTYNQYEAQIGGQINDINTKNELAEKSLIEAKAGLNSLIKQKETSLNEIDAKIKEAEGSKSQAGVMIGNSKIYSPINGVVIKQVSEVGQVIGGGMPVLVVADDKNIKVTISVPEDIINSINVGTEAILELEGITNQIKGKVLKILPTKDMVSKKVGVEIEILDKNNDYKIGSYVKVYFPSSIEEGIIVPNNSIVAKFMIPGIYVLEDGKAIFKNIEILKQNDNFSSIKGLNIGDIIIIDGKENIWDGEKISLNKNK